MRIIGQKTVYLFFAIVTVAPFTMAMAENINIYLLTGQSNSLGTTANPAEYGAPPDPSPIDAQIPFWWSNLSTSETELGDSGGQIKTLQVQQSLDLTTGNPNFWGPEFGFARTFHSVGQRNFMVIKVSRSGGGNTNWSKADGGAMYSRIITQVNAAAAAITANGDTFQIAGLMYLQGESDDAAEAGLSGARLAILISNLRSDLPNASNMYTVIGGIAAEGATRDVVRAQQSALAASDPTIDYFDTTDLRPHLYDALHYDKTAKMLVGERYANAFLSIVPEPSSSLLVLGVMGLVLPLRNRGRSK